MIISWKCYNNKRFSIETSLAIALWSVDKIIFIFSVSCPVCWFIIFLLVCLIELNHNSYNTFTMPIEFWWTHISLEWFWGSEALFWKRKEVCLIHFFWPINCFSKIHGALETKSLSCSWVLGDFPYLQFHLFNHHAYSILKL